MRVKYFQQGGLAQAQAQAQAANVKKQVEALVQAAMSGDQQATQQVNQILEAAKAGDQQAALLAQMIQAVAQKLQGLATMNKWGSKLEYIRSLKFAKGGKTCPACMAAGGQTKKKSNTYIASSDTVHVQGKPKSLVDSQGNKSVKHLPEYTASDYQKDLKDAKKGKKDAANRVEKQDMKTAYGCGGKAGKVKKHGEGGWMEMLPLYGTYLSGKRFFKNPSWKAAGEFGLDLAGDVALLSGVGAGAGAALKAAKVANTINKGTKLSKGLKTAKNIVANKPAGGYQSIVNQMVGKELTSIDDQARAFDYVSDMYNLSKQAPLLGAQGFLGSRVIDQVSK